MNSYYRRRQKTTLSLLALAVTALALLGAAEATAEQAPNGAAISGQEEKEARARSYIAALEPILYEALDRESLGDYEDVFFDYYNEVLRPRLKNASRFIDARAMQWVDVEGDGSKELLFWTEGLAPSAWGPQEKIFFVRGARSDEEGAVKVDEQTHIKLVASKNIEPSLGGAEAMRYLSSAFYEFKRRDGSFVWVLAFMQLGGAKATHVSLEMTPMRNGKGLDFKRSIRSFPIAVSDAIHMPTRTRKPDLKRARSIIKAVRHHLANTLFGREGTWPELKLHKKIEDEAIYWIDMNWDNEPELLFWTKGLSRSAWNGRDHMFLVQVTDDAYKIIETNTTTQVDKKGRQFASILYRYRFDAFGYEGFSFHMLPMESRGHNDFVRGVVTLTEERADNDVYHIIEMTINKYKWKNAIHFRWRRVPFPVGIR